VIQTTRQGVADREIPRSNHSALPCSICTSQEAARGEGAAVSGLIKPTKWRKNAMSKRPNPPLLLAACLILALLVIGLPPNTAQAQTTTKTFKTIADTFIISLYPNNAYGGSSITRVDGSPVARTYLRFTVSGLKGATVRSAILRVYATSSNSSGITVSRLNNNTWKESTLTYKNAPPPGTALKTSPAITAGRWVAINLTGYVKADGTYNLVLTPRNTISVTFAARESGANAAQLVITTGNQTQRHAYNCRSNGYCNRKHSQRYRHDCTTHGYSHRNGIHPQRHAHAETIAHPDAGRFDQSGSDQRPRVDLHRQ
jgi:hypothetical protein